jgi:pre-60S factor REI1
MEKIYTCVNCRVAFHTFEQQKLHFHSEWHRYNLKRKVADLPPLSNEDYQKRINKEESEKNNPSAELNCLICKKSYSSANALKSHLESKKHIKMAALPREETPTIKEEKKNKIYEEKSIIKNLKEAKTEEKIMKLLEEKVRNAPKLDINFDCIFCPNSSLNFEENLNHMKFSHSFFIPDIEYLIDIFGLLQYLADKVSKSNLCLFCNGKGKAFLSVDSVWKHMQDKGHSKIAYENGADGEYSKFYDFSSSWEDIMEEDDDGGRGRSKATLSSGQLVLNNGRKKALGHRSMARYFKQKYKPDESGVDVLINRFACFDGSMINSLPYSSRKFFTPSIKTFQRVEKKKNLSIGMKHNYLQHHFREQIL